MDPAQLNLMMLGGGGMPNMQGLGSVGNNHNFADVGQDAGLSQDQLQQQQQTLGNYPSLLRQLQQQQQQLQQQQMMQGMGMSGLMGMNGMNMGMMGGLGGLSGQDGQGMAQGGGTGMAGMQGMGMAGMQGMGLGMPGTVGSQGPDYMDANRMLLQRLQGQNQADQFDAMNAAGLSTSLANAAGDGNPGDPYADSGILGPWSATSAGLLGKMAVSTQDKGKKIRRKSKDKPKRPLSAYNIFFKEERQRILAKIPEGDDKKEETPVDTAKGRKRKKQPHGKIGFENLAKVIGQRWQELTPDQVEYYKKKAEEDMKRYKNQMEEYLAKQDSDKKKASGDNGDGLPADDDETHMSKKMKLEG